MWRPAENQWQLLTIAAVRSGWRRSFYASRMMLAIDSTAHGRGPISRTKPRNHCLPGAELIVRIYPPPAASLQTLGSCRLSGTPLKQPLDNSGQIIAPARQSHAQHTHYPYSSPVTGEVRTSTDQFAVSAVQALEQTNMSCHDGQAQVITHGLSSEAARPRPVYLARRIRRRRQAPVAPRQAAALLRRLQPAIGAVGDE